MKHQPTKDQLKDQLALAAEEIIRLNEALDACHAALDRIDPPPQPWWRRLLR